MPFYCPGCELIRGSLLVDSVKILRLNLECALHKGQSVCSVKKAIHEPVSLSVFWGRRLRSRFDAMVEIM